MSLKGATLLQLKPIPFDGRCFQRWKFKVKCELNARGILFMLDNPDTDVFEKAATAGLKRFATSDLVKSYGGESKLAKIQVKLDAAYASAYNRLASEIHSWLVNSQADAMIHVLQNVGLGDAHRAWTSLTDEYDRDTVASKRLLRREFNSLAIGRSNFTSYSEKVRSLSLRLKDMGDQISDEDMVTTILTGLFERYDPIVTALAQIGWNVVKFTGACSLLEDFSYKLSLRGDDRDKEKALPVKSRAGQRETCRNFQKWGKCKFGDDCRHLHVGRPPRPAPLDGYNRSVQSKAIHKTKSTEE